jgi:antitoxin component of MazEF toxin-antitoxin module
MQVQITRVGSELMIEIPEEMVAEAGFAVGEPLESVFDSEGRMTLWRPACLAASKARKRLTIEELLEGIPEGAITGEYDWGPPRGVEFW